MKNIVLIGMPGAGKTTIGSILSQKLNMTFIDTDILIKQKSGKSPQQIIDDKHTDEFLSIEENVVMDLNLKNFVVSTGGSVVCSSKAVNHLKSNGIVVYLKADYHAIEKRIRNPKTRGIVFKDGQDLLGVYNERVPLYENYSDITIDCSDKSVNDVVDSVINILENKKKNSL